MLETIINTSLKVCITFHDILHVSCTGRGTGTNILELKLTQDMSSIDQDPLLRMLLDLQKLYDTLDRGHFLKAMDGYGTGPHLCRILVGFWEQQEVINRQNGYHGPHLHLFYMIVNNVVCKCLSMTVEEKLFAHDGLVHEDMRCGLVGSWDPECLQGALSIFIGLF